MKKSKITLKEIFKEHFPEEDFDKESGSPIVLCPECDADMIMKK